MNTTVTRDVSITVDAGYRTQLASGSGINAPFSFDFDSCGAGGGFTGPGTCTVKQSFRPTAAGPFGGTTNVFQCPVAGGSCIAIPYTVSGTGITATTSTALTSSANPSAPSQTVTFAAQVFSASGTAVPSGSVTFTDGATTLGTVTLSGGSATFTTSTLALGSHNIQASYGGSPEFAPSSGSLTQIVQDTTSTTLTSSPNPSLLNQQVVFTATIRAGSGAVIPTGSVTFTNGGTALGTVALNGGSATLTTSTLALGSHNIQASYSGATGLATSSATVTQVVQNTTTTTLTSSANPSVQAAPVTFTARVAPTSGIGAPTGSVTFSDGSTVLGTVALSGGVATLKTAALAPGTHTITASYGGSPTYRPSSASLDQVVKGVTALLVDLATDVSGVGPNTSFADKVRDVQSSLAAGQPTAACSQLAALLNQIRAQSGKSLTAAQARQLTDEINVIRSLIPCA